LPEVQSEVTALASLFPDAVVLLDENATIGALQAYAPTADVLHLACHGQFDLITRSSLPCVSPMAGSRLYDAYQLDLRCTMVSLSACETGISMVVPGDELIGLARGFFAAGAPSLLVSLWSADDAATARLMGMFYARLFAGDGPAAALRHAQRQLLAECEHPFFWAAFVLVGRW
jgi:CHAT domain-containing protein